MTALWPLLQSIIGPLLKGAFVLLGNLIEGYKREQLGIAKEQARQAREQTRKAAEAAAKKQAVEIQAEQEPETAAITKKMEDGTF